MHIITVTGQNSIQVKLLCLLTQLSMGAHTQ